jgi:DNA ligase (NAD+)
MDLACILRFPMTMEANIRIQKLRRLINQHDYQYHVLGVSDMPDAEYDALFHELVTLENEHSELMDVNSPTQRVGGLGQNSFEKVRHERRMLSLDNCFSARAVLDKFPGEELLMEPKVDGLSMKLIYRRGHLMRAITRGNGDSGDDVTVNARTIMTVPMTLQEPLDIEVTGEVYMTHTVFNELNNELEAQEDEPFANARNAAAGTLKLKNARKVHDRRLSFVAHGTSTEVPGVTRQMELVRRLETLGFQSTFQLPVVKSCDPVTRVLVAGDRASIERAIAEADVNRKCLNLATDGLVFKVNDLVKQRELGDGTRAPKWALAFKFPPERKQTTLVAVVLQVGKTGRVTPVAELKPVALSGTIVRRASLCNQDEIARLNVNHGDEVLIEKSAEIIPKVMGVAEKKSAGHFLFPERCPCCGTRLKREDGQVDYFCPNKRGCDDQVFARLKHATGKDALDIEGCGKSMVRELMRHGVRRLSDLFSLKDATFLKQAARKKFMEGRERAKRQPMWRQLHALSIEGLGAVRCQEISAAWDSLSAVIDEMDKLKSLLSKEEDGGVIFRNFEQFIISEEEELCRLEQLGLHFAKDRASVGKLSGKVFVITGTLVSGSRDAVIRRIEAAGGMVKPSVSAKCHYLIKGTEAGRTKVEKAAKCGIPVIAEMQLYEMLGTPMPVAEALDPNREF